MSENGGVTKEDLWRPDEVLGTPLRIGEWLYNGAITLAVRLFRSATLYGSGDDEEGAGEDRTVECYYLEVQSAGDERWASRRAFLRLDDIDRFGREELGDTLRWHD